MNTTTAAQTAKVTVATIRDWARRGIIAATKVAGRWVIDTASLTRRIAIGAMKTRTTSTTYRIEEVQIVKYGQERTAYRIVRTDGTPAGFRADQDARIRDAEFHSRDTAEFYADFYENTPDGYRIERTAVRAHSMNRTPNWLLTGCTNGDPASVRMTLPTDWTAEGKNFPEGTRQVDVLIAWASTHAAGAGERIQAKAEKDIVAAAEAAVREAREAQLAEARRAKGPLATPKQVDYILALLARREFSGEGGGFFYGPTDRAGLEEMARVDASSYITSLKGDY